MIDQENSDDDFQPVITARKRKEISQRKHNNASVSRKKAQGRRKSFNTIFTARIKNEDESSSGTNIKPPAGNTALNIKKVVVSEANSTNTGEDLKITSKKGIVVKTTINNIWKPSYIQPLHELMNIISKVVAHTYVFVKYIFLKEPVNDIEFDLNGFINRAFFVEVFLSLIDKQARNGRISGKTRPNNTTKRYRELIGRNKVSYCEDANYIPPKLANAQQIALYEYTKILTSYQNNVKAHLEKLNNLNERMKEEGSTNDTIKEARLEEIFHSCSLMKLDVAKKKLSSADILDQKSRAEVKALLSTYPNDYKFQKDSIFYDVVAHPANYFKAFYKLAPFFESEDLKQFNCFPLPTSFIPAYITLDTKIVNYHIIKSKKPANNKTEIWEKIISGDLEKKQFKNQGTEKALSFEGTIECHGFLRCKNPECLVKEVLRFYSCCTIIITDK